MAEISRTQLDLKDLFNKSHRNLHIMHKCVPENLHNVKTLFTTSSSQSLGLQVVPPTSITYRYED